MEELIYANGYQKYRQELRTELEKTSEGFVRIGYLLKIARDTDILKDSGYKDYLDFAQGEYGLDKSMVSRFIRINDRFSEGGSSERLLEQYKGFGYAKLAIMLTIPEVIAEELTPDLTKSEITEIKEQVDEEKSKSDIEHFMEEQDSIMNPPEDSIIVQTMKAIGKDYPSIYVSIFDGLENIEAPGNIQLKSILLPIDPSVYMTRVPGKGKVIIVCRNSSVAITEVRAEIKTEAAWDEIAVAWREVITKNGGSDQTGKDSWQQAYGEEFPDDDEPAKCEAGDSKADAEPKELSQNWKTAKAQNKQQASKGKVAPVQPKKVNTPKKKKPQKEKTETPLSKNDENEQKTAQKTPESENATPHESESVFEGDFKPDFEPLQIAETLENTAKLIRNGDFTHARGLLEDALKALTHILEKKQEDN